MSIKYQPLAVGERISWPAINGKRSGTVESIDDHGALVLLDEGRYVLLTTGQSMEATKRRRRLAAQGKKSRVV